MKRFGFRQRNYGPNGRLELWRTILSNLRYWGVNHRIGRIGSLVAPGYSVCGRCHTPWAFVKSRTVRIRDDHGVFSLCERCWGECSIDERLGHFAADWQRFWRDGFAWLEIELAVREGRAW